MEKNKISKTEFVEINNYKKRRNLNAHKECWTEIEDQTKEMALKQLAIASRDTFMSEECRNAMEKIIVQLYS
jgi:hypothetical protein